MATLSAIGTAGPGGSRRVASRYPMRYALSFFGLIDLLAILPTYLSLFFSGTQYLLDGKWVDTRKVVETIAVRGGETFYDTVVYTHWGPVPYDRNFHARNELSQYAFRWIAHDPSEEISTFHRLNRAKNYSEFMEALDFYSLPAQNFVFASVAGDIAMRVQGKFPVRRKDEGKFLIDGSNSANGNSCSNPSQPSTFFVDDVAVGADFIGLK